MHNISKYQIHTKNNSKSVATALGHLAINNNASCDTSVETDKIYVLTTSWVLLCLSKPRGVRTWWQSGALLRYALRKVCGSSPSLFAAERK